MNSQKCQSCPHNSDAPEASSSWKDCMCVIGTIQEKNGSLSCECPSGEAFIDVQPGPERCESCQKLKLDCPNAGSNASTAPVQNGRARLQLRSYKVHQCLDPAQCLSSGCAEGQSESFLQVLKCLHYLCYLCSFACVTCVPLCVVAFFVSSLTGYAGRLCSDCAPGNHENLGQCKRCSELQNISITRMVACCLLSMFSRYFSASFCVGRHSVLT